MNRSRGVISAETVAATNEPLLAASSRQHPLQHRLGHNSHIHSSNSAAAASFHNNNDNPLSPVSAIADYFTKSIHQQLNPSTSSLPSLLARSLVFSSNNSSSSGGGGSSSEATEIDSDQQQQQLLLQERQQATDIDNYNQNYEQSFSDWWIEYWSRQPFPSGYTQSSITLLACLITTIIFLIVVGNLLVVVAIFTEKSLKPTQNWFIASLAVSDMLLGLVVMPFSLARELMGFWIFGPLWCDIHEAIDVLLTTASINTLCLISLDRYWSITQAVNYLKKRTPKRGAFMIAFVWIFSAAVSLPPLFGWKKQSPTIIANITVSPSSSSHHKHHKQHAAKLSNSAKPLQTTTTTTSSTIIAADEPSLSPAADGQPDDGAGAGRRRRAAGALSRRRRQELATPITMMDAARRQVLPVPVRAPLQRQQGNSRLLLLQQPSAYTKGPDDDDFQVARSLQLQHRATFRTDNQDAAGSNRNSQSNAIMQSVLSTTTGSPAAAESSQVTEYPSCQLSDDIGYVLYSALGSFYIPCAVMVFTYIKIFLAARSRARRAINKQSRGAVAAANKRLAARRTLNPSQPPTAGGGNKLLAAETSGNSNPITSCNSVAVSTTGMSQLPATAAGANSQPDTQKSPPPMMKGKIVIVERKKSLAPISTAQLGDINLPSSQHHEIDMIQSPASIEQLNRATYTCSEIVTSSSGSLVTEQQSNKTKFAGAEVGAGSEQGGGTQVVEMQPGGGTGRAAGSCTLTMSAAKQASPSALNGDGMSHDSSMITVMNASMADTPVTRFNFRHRGASGDSAPARSATAGSCDIERGGGAGQPDDGSRKAAALLRALSEAVKPENEDQLLRSVWPTDGGGGGETSGGSSNAKQQQSHGQSDDRLRNAAAIVAKNGGNGDHNNINNSNSDGLAPHGQLQQEELQQQTDGQVNTTNETCFMTIEEDSDMFDGQTGRTIMMIAGNASQKQANNLGKAQGGIMMTMLPPGAAANQHTQQPIDGQQHQAVICNNVVCMRPHQPAAATRSGSSYCGSSLTINDDDIDDCVDDELTDDCNGYSASCGYDQYYSGRISTCPQCQECAQQQQQLQQHDMQEQEQQELRQMSNIDRHLSISDSLSRKNKHNKQQQQQQHHHHHHHHHLGRRISETHSMTGDDNLSLNEYRSNEDESSSIMGHDVLDATETVHKTDKTRPSSGGSNDAPNFNRKKSSIGFRLTRLGSTTPVSVQAGGLLALASSQQQQQQQQQLQQTTGGTRNLKALRQNFFLKLNQLTAKSAAKQQEHKSKKLSDTSPTGKSSAQSSGTSFEPSGDCPTTSNVHSADYQPEITADDPQSSPTSKGADSRDQQHRGSNSSSTNSSSTSNNNNNNKQRQASNQDKQTNLQPGMSTNQSGKSSPASDMFKKSAGNSNNQMIDKNDDRALLLHDPQNGGAGGDKRLMGGGKSNSMLATSGQNGKPSQMKFSGEDNQQQLQRTRGSGGQGDGGGHQMNHSSATAPSGGAPPSSNRGAYLASDNERHKRKQAKARERRATLILGLIMGAFVCSWMPFFTFYVLRALCTVCRDYISPRFEAFIFWMGYCNSAINPIIYTIFNRDFRKAFRKILFKCI